MNLNKTAISVALAAILNTGAAQALQSSSTIFMDYSGLFTMQTQADATVQNVSYPYYGDPTWGYGFRTQISGTMSFDTNTGAGTGTVNPFDFMNSGPAIASDLNFQAIGDGAGNPGSLIIGNMTFSWNGNNITTQIVLDASGLFAEVPTIAIGDVYDASTCNSSGACAIPASDNIRKGSYPIGPVPIATSSFNTTGQTGYGTTIGQLSLGTDDGVGGSPMDNGPFSGYNANFDITTISITTGPEIIPIPAAVWLFGSGLLGLAAVARRRKA